MLRTAQLDMFVLRQTRYNRPFGRFRYDINLAHEVSISSAAAHIERVCVYRKFAQRIYIDALRLSAQSTKGACANNRRYASQNAMRYARLDIFSFHSNSIYSPFGRTRYDINPRSRSEHIECAAHIELRQQHIENPHTRIYINALR